MPHQCTTCERTFPDGSKAMLGGCPDCGGNKFQFQPEGVAESDDSEILEAPSEPPDRDSDADQTAASGEDAAQADARSSVVKDRDLPRVDDRDGVLEEIANDATPAEPGTDETPELDTLRAELNDQFESIKIVSPGEYELNLMELYDREEYIIALEEDGRYVIDVPTDVDAPPEAE